MPTTFNPGPPVNYGGNLAMVDPAELASLRAIADAATDYHNASLACRDAMAAGQPVGELWLAMDRAERALFELLEGNP